MSRFIRSALFPILIVIIVAMFIEWVISGNNADRHAQGDLRGAVRHHARRVLSSDLQNDIIKNVVIDPAGRRRAGHADGRRSSTT